MTTTAAARPKKPLASIIVGRTLTGVAFAHLTEGSVIVITKRAATRRGAARRVQRKARRRYGETVPVVAFADWR